ncbi:Zinc carboxypeptidase [Phytophthora infestans]|uniref:tubulin-glutamate carboxypeptidase n=1 Tax=Phytophthora infestans TaxID=4787 RepID=A0A833TK34_PHYIN|nr:Zinc carboxypeptidase [Phytophthora infestans]
MSTAQALLTRLQDRGKNTPTSVRHILLELASCCRSEGAKVTILTDGLEPLLALAAGDQELPRGETLEVLLELLTLIVLENPDTKTNAVRGGAMELAIRCLHEVSVGAGGSRRRAKILKRALELVNLLSQTTESKQQGRQTVVIKQILEMMARPDEDESVLVRATDTLGRFIDGSVKRIQVATQEHAITILIGLLNLTGDSKLNLKRTVCEVLILMGEAPGMLQMMAKQDIVSALCVCLRMDPRSREVECGAVRLLSRIVRDAQMYGQIVREEMIPLLLQVIEHNSNTKEMTVVTCAIIADLSDFARQCKLDLSPFVKNCKGQMLVLAATCHAQEASVADNTFRFFVNVSNNPVDIPHLINSETIEGLLSLYVLAGGSGYLAELAGHLVHVISRLSRSTLEQFTMQEEDITLPALFLCLRNYQENIRFASQVLAILAKHWKTQCYDKSVQAITGYIGIAIDILCRTIPSSTSWGDQTVDIVNFVREMMLSKNGADAVMSCGGKDLLEMLHTYLDAREENLPPDVESAYNHEEMPTPTASPLLSNTFGGESIASIVVKMLEKAVLGISDVGAINDISSSDSSASVQQLPSSSRRTGLRLGDAEYEDYVSKLLRLESSCHFKPIETSGRTAISIEPETMSYAIQPKEYCAESKNDIEESVEQKLSEESESVDVISSPEYLYCGEDGVAGTSADNGEENDDDSDDEEEVGSIEKEEFKDGSVEVARVPSLYSSSLRPSIEHRTPNKTTRREVSTMNFFDHLEDKKWYYADKSFLVKFPKHPSRMNHANQTNSEEKFVLDDPGFLEPCSLSEPEDATRFVDEAVARRAEFVASDANLRARVVYENLSMVEERDHSVAGIPSFLLTFCDTQRDVPYFVPEDPEAFPDLASSLTFDSNFESGNLARAIRIGQFEYDLVLRPDFNTSGHMQWFYFAVSNIQTPESSSRAGQKYRFNIVNLCKPNSLFNQGLQPVVYSVRDAHQKGKGWVRSGTDIYYFANSFVRPLRNAASFPSVVPTEAAPTTTLATPAAPVMTYYTLTFTLEFWNADDTFLIAHSYPYTLTMHQLHIDRILHSGRDASHILRHSSLCTTLSGRSCELLTISDFSIAEQEFKARKAVFITSRVHPGESQASWMMRGVIDFLLGSSNVARVLRRMFVFQIIPILNPDGVYYGNSRCGLSACDLNRQWQTPSKALHPTIFHAKELLIKERSSRGVAFYCDMHGHSRKKNVFMYGCDTKRKPNPAARGFAKLFSMQQTAKKYISFPDCSFKVSKDKETTARVVVANELRINWSFTLEASFCGANFGELYSMHFNTKHLREVGASLCETLFQACTSDLSIRDKLLVKADDAKVCIPQLIEPYLRESRVIGDKYPVDGDTDVKPRSSFRKFLKENGRYVKKMPNESSPKSVRRKSSKARAIAALDAGTSKTADTNESSGSRRRLSRQQRKSTSFSSGLLDRVTSDTSGSTDSTNCLDLACIPPPKLSGRKLRSKYPKVRRTHSSPDGHVRSRRRAISSLASSAAVDNSEDSETASDSIMPLVSPARLLAAVPDPPTSSVRALTSFQGPESAYKRSSRAISFPYPNSVVGIPLRESPVILPSPVNEAMTRSPKTLVSRLRFR